MNSGQDEPEKDPLFLSNQIDVICDEFEASWLRNQRPQIAEFLLDTVGAAKSTLFAELVKIDVAYRRAIGERTSRADYRARFPDYSEVVAWLEADFDLLDPRADSPTHQIGSLRLITEVGSGSFGSVWKAWDSKLERIVAVKISLDSNITSPSLEHFDREAKAIARLHHPGIVAVYDSGVDEHRAFIVLQFIEGETLKDLLARKKPTHQQAANFCLQLADALGHAHQNGVLHRDLKPGNVLIDKDGQPYVTDFGLARRMDATATQAQPGSIVGTLAYMSPEQAEGRPAKFDGRSDIYSLGAILYEMLSGRIPFEGKPREILSRILNVEPTPPKQLDRTIPDDLETICLKCLAKHPTDRYASAGALAADLRRFLNSAPLHGRRIRPHVRLWRWGQRQPAVVASYATALLAIFVLGLFAVNKLAVVDIPSLEPDKWIVNITTEPAGAEIVVIRRDPNSGELLPTKMIASQSLTPCRIQLAPGDYYGKATLKKEDRSQEFERHVPQVGEATPFGSTNNEFFTVVASGELEWPVVRIPPTSITNKMCFIQGTDHFLVGDPRVPGSVHYRRIPSFYVMPREFTYEDFFELRPKDLGTMPPDKPRGSQPRGNAMTGTYDYACHWAELAGGRLPTEWEFEYLAVKAAEIASRSPSGPLDPSQLHVAGGDVSDEIPGMPPVRGILSGLSEWVQSFPPGIPVPEKWRQSPHHPEDVRVVRGGDATVAYEGKLVPSWQRAARGRIAAYRWQALPGVSFRVVRSAELRSRPEDFDLPVPFAPPHGSSGNAVEPATD